MRRRAIALVVVAVAACGGTPPPVAPPPPRPPPKPPALSATDHATADSIAHAYQVLTAESAVPGDPSQLRAAAIQTLAPSGWLGTPLAWTDDPAKDVVVMRGAVETLALRGALPADAVLRAARAMTLAANDTHTFALSKPSLAALNALIGGGPVVQPGMLYHKLDDGRWAVSDVVPGSPAQTAGVQRGDTLVSVDGMPVVHGYMDFAPLLGAPDGTEAMLVVERNGDNKGLVLRMAAVAQPIVDSRVLAGGLGYVRVWACTQSDDPARDAGKLLAVVLADFDKKKVKKLVIDLRGNAGGFPFDLASLLVDVDPLLIAVVEGGEQPVARTKTTAWKTKRPVVVIVNELTASGAEMLALVLRDHAKAKLIGRTTAGALTFPTTDKLSGDVTLSYPLSRVGSVKTKQPLDGNRLIPEVAAPNPTAEQYAGGKDPQLDAAVAALKAMK